MTRSGYGILKNGPFALFFSSQLLTGAASYIQTVAAANLLVRTTGSGLTAGLGVVLTPLPGVLFSLLAGRLGDGCRPKRLLVGYDLLRGLLALLCPLCGGFWPIAGVLLLSGMTDVFYGPPRSRLLSVTAGSGRLLDATSLLSGGGGAVSLLTPAAAGVLIELFGVQYAFAAASLLYALSALLLSGVKTAPGPVPAAGSGGRPARASIREGMRRVFGSGKLLVCAVTLAALDFGSAAVNLSFYAFAFDELKVTTGYWGMLLSVLYGMNLLAMAVILRFKTYFKSRPVRKAAGCLIAVAGVWCFYSLTKSTALILCGAAAEGFFASVCTTLLTSSLLENAGGASTARVMSVRDMLSYAAKLSGLGMAYGLLAFFKPQFAFSVSAAVLLTYAVLLLPVLAAGTVDVGAAERAERGA